MDVTALDSSELLIAPVDVKSEPDKGDFCALMMMADDGSFPDVKHSWESTKAKPEILPCGDAVKNEDACVTEQLCSIKMEQSPSPCSLIRQADKPHLCEICGQTFAKVACFNFHMSVHATPDEIKPETKLEISPADDANSQELTSDIFSNHATQPTNQNSEIFSSGDNSDNGNCREVVQHCLPVKSHRCELCDKFFVHLSELESHRMTHRSEKSREESGQQFTLVEGLKSRVTTHEGENPYSCGVCGNYFTTSESLKRHKLTYRGENPCTAITSLKDLMNIHLCDVCGQRFADANSLAFHMRMHTREKTQSCDVCGKPFTQDSSLKSHLHSQTADKPHLCEICGQTFAKVVCFNFHMSEHARERTRSCKECGKIFKLTSALTRHKRVHARQKPHMCAVCGKQWIWSAKLRRYIGIHTGNKLNSCRACEKHVMNIPPRNCKKTIHKGTKPHSGEL